MLFTTKVKGGMAVYWLFKSPALLNCREYKPGLKDWLAAILKYAVYLPKSIFQFVFIVKKSVEA